MIKPALPPSRHSTATRPSLLVRVRDKNDDLAWSEFVKLYSPLIYGYVRKRGLQDADATDLTQDVLLSVFQAMKGFKYDTSRGRFRNWLFTATRNRLIKVLERNKRTVRGAANSEVAEMLNQQADTDADFDLSFDWCHFLAAAEQVKNQFVDKSWEAFRRNVIDGESAAKVAESLKMSVGAVYIAKSRVLAAVRQHLSITG